MGGQYFFPNSAQPGTQVRRVRRIDDARVWFERVDRSDETVWQATGSGSRDRAYFWDEINDKALVDATGEAVR